MTEEADDVETFFPFVLRGYYRPTEEIFNDLKTAAAHIKKVNGVCLPVYELELEISKEEK